MFVFETEKGGKSEQKSYVSEETMVLPCFVCGRVKPELIKARFYQTS